MRWTIFILLVCGLQGLAQTPGADDFLDQEYFISTVAKGTKQYVERHPTEKIYVHFDRPYYLISDTAWFKIYVVDAQLHPTTNSIAVFVDWTRQDGSLVKHQQFQLLNGQAHGYFAFLDAPKGAYNVSAYTNLMAKESPDYLYRAQFDLIDPLESRASDKTPVTQQSGIDLQFLPEGGVMVDGLESQVAFKALDPNGNGIMVKGDVVDDLNHPVAKIQSTHRGTGVFTLKPAKGRKYRFTWDSKVFELPGSIPSGVVMRVNNDNPEVVEVTIQASDDLLPGRFYLIGLARGSICYRDMFTLDETTMVLKLPKKSMPPGVLQLTLFDENSMPRCERMVYLNQDVDNKIDIRFDKATYAPRELISLNIGITDQQGVPVKAQLSVAITDRGFAKRDLMKGNIRTQFLLQSDLKGHIEQPGWYFENVSAEHVLGLDLLMLTNGWRKFNWLQVLSETSGKPYVRETGLAIAGRILDPKTSKPVPEADITLLTNLPLKGSVYTATAGPDGNFRIKDLVFNDSTRFVWQIRNKKGQQIDAGVVFAAPGIPSIDRATMMDLAHDQPDIPLDDLRSRVIATGSWDVHKAELLAEVKITGKKIDTPQSGSQTFIPGDYHRLSLEVTAEEAMNYTDVTSMIRDKFPNVTFFGAGVNQDVRIRGIHKSLQTDKVLPPMILLDGQIVSTEGIEQGGAYHALNIIPVSEIKKIEVMTGAAAAIYGSRAGSGVIAIYSKGTSGRVIVDKTGPGKGVLKVAPPGYESPREFYQPTYQKDRTSSAGSGLRVTLFWTPTLQTDDSGKAQIQFYNSDAAQSFQVVVEGMANGVPLAGVK